MSRDSTSRSNAWLLAAGVLLVALALVGACYHQERVWERRDFAMKRSFLIMRFYQELNQAALEFEAGKSDRSPDATTRFACRLPFFSPSAGWPHFDWGKELPDGNLELIARNLDPHGVSSEIVGHVDKELSVATIESGAIRAILNRLREVGEERWREEFLEAATK